MGCSIEPIRTIHPNDRMWQPGESWYFAVGRSALRVVDIATRLSRLTHITSILDLPCGHGRIARYLRAAFPDANMHFCDIQREGAAFCAEIFGGTAIFSQPELTHVQLPEVDLIWVGSLFTHVDADRTTRWIRYLCEHLTPDGVLIATFHGDWSIQMHENHYPMIDAQSWAKIRTGYTETGYGYAPYSELVSMDYGISLSRPEFIVDLIRSIPGVRLASYMERGWSDNQDVAIITRHDRNAPWTPDFSSGR